MASSWEICKKQPKHAVSRARIENEEDLGIEIVIVVIIVIVIVIVIGIVIGIVIVIIIVIVMVWLTSSSAFGDFGGCRL